MRLKFALIVGTALVAGCDASPTAPTSWSEGRLREQMIISNLNSVVFGSAGRLTRWRVPIPANTNGIARAEAALSHYEAWTGGVVRFQRVNQNPANGLIFLEGGAGGSEATDSCGSFGDIDPATGGSRATLQYDAARAIVGSYTVHLGADRCDDRTAGAYPSAVAEHLVAHALGVIDHFDGFQHRTGLDDPRLLAVVYNLYANAPGASANELTIWRAP